MLATGCLGEQGETGPQGPEGPPGAPGDPGALDPNLSTFDKAFAGIGGQATLEALTSFTLESSGSRLIDNEGFSPGDANVEVSTFTQTVSHDIGEDSLRVDIDRVILFAGGAPLSYSEIVVGDVGVVDGVDSIFGFGTGDMPSSRMAAVRKQHRLLNPHLILKDVLANPGMAAEAGFQLHDGVVHEILRVDDPTAPIDLFVNPATGQIAKLVTTENHHLERDVQIEVHYQGWQVYGAGALFPSEVFIVLDADLMHIESRSEVVINPAIDAATFDFPAGSAPMFDQAVADFGERSHQFHQSFAGLGLPFDAPQLFVAEVQLTPGVFHVVGGSHNSMAIEQAAGVVLVEAPLYPERSEAILAWAAGRFPGKPITHVIATHHHEDHAAGLRTFVASGATIVLSERNEAFLRDVFRAPSTIVPDALAQNPRGANILTVPVGGQLTLPDATNPVTAYHHASLHAADLLVIHSEGSNHVFNSDLWNPGNGGSTLVPQFAIDLHAFIVDNIGGQPEMVGGHGAVAPFSELDAFVNAL